jgi:glutamyl-tRNA synthetase
MSASPSDRPVRVRIAPSPTGDPHVGTAYIALFNLAFAKQRGGSFIVRIEDTDRARSTPQSEAAIFDALRWLGISWDEGPDIGGPHAPYRQSERLDIYRRHVEELVARGHAYWCTCSSERLDQLRKEQEKNKASIRGYDGHCREAGHTAGSVVRLKVPKGQGQQTTFQDAFREAAQVWDNAQVDDQVLMKSDGFPTYHLANVVDDHLMGITHVLRGEEWLSSTPKHVILYESFGWQPPVFAHLPLLRNADKSKVSKRKNPVSLSWFREVGYLPEAMVNFLGMMAFTFEDGREMFSLPDFIEHFKMERVVLGGPVFDLKKLQAFQGRYLREKKSDVEVVQYLKERLFSDPYLEQIVRITKDRFDKSEDFIELASYFFTGSVSFDVKELVLKGKTPKESAELYAELVEKIDVLFDWRADTVADLLTRFSEEKGLGAKDLYAPLRWMMTGKKGSPPIPDVLAILGRERVRTRMRATLDPLKKLPPPAPATAPPTAQPNPVPTEKGK